MQATMRSVRTQHRADASHSPSGSNSLARVSNCVCSAASDPDRHELHASGDDPFEPSRSSAAKRESVSNDSSIRHLCNELHSDCSWGSDYSLENARENWWPRAESNHREEPRQYTVSTIRFADLLHFLLQSSATTPA